MVPIATQSLLCRHFAPDDAHTALALSREPAARAWLPSQVYRDEAHAREALAYLIDCYAKPGDPRLGPYVLAVEHRVDGVLIGHVGFSPLDGDVEIGFSIAERYQGRGLAGEAVAAAADWAFRTFGLERIVAVASAANVASKRTLLRAGFTHERDERVLFQGAEENVSRHVLARPGA